MPLGALPSWVSSLPLWRWYELPNTALSSVDPVPRPMGFTGPSSKIDAWCGATLRRAGSVYLIGAAGGHADYAGNEVDALALNVATPAWVQLRAPTPDSAVLDRAQFYLDNRPAATHSYYATQYIDRLDRMMVFSSAGLTGLGTAAPANYPYTSSIGRSFSFNYQARDWDAPDYVAQFPGIGDSIACLCVKHPVTGDVYLSRNSGDGWYRWTAALNTWRRLPGFARAPWYGGAAIDPRRQRMLVVGSYSPIRPAVYDLTGGSIAVTFRGLGEGPLGQLIGYPGVVYEEVLDRFLVFYNTDSGVKMYAVDAATWTVEEPLVTGVAPVRRTNGVLNAVQFVPELRGVVFANKHNGNVHFMRTSS